MWLWGYNTNGAGDHPLETAIAILSDLGYRSVAITIDHSALNPFSPTLAAEVRHLERQLRRSDMRSFIETGARYFLDPLRKHEPSLVSADPAGRQRRSELLIRALAIARDLGSAGVSFWSGKCPEGDTRQAREVHDIFRRALEPLVRAAEQAQVILALEAEPGMFIERNQQARDLVQSWNSPYLGLTLDVGHLACLGEPWEEIDRSSPWLKNVHIEDMRHGEHIHLPFGEGEIDFAEVFPRLADHADRVPIHVELSRHSHAFPELAQSSLSFLRTFEGVRVPQ